jgi:hypothetical protein
MSLRAIPLIVFSFILYNVIVVIGGGGDVAALLRKEFIPLPLMTQMLWLTWGDVIILATMVLLFIELMKSTYTSTASLLDHGLSMLVFVACLIEFLMVSLAATAVFFFVTVAALIDVVAGYTIGIRVARRDLAIGDG